MEGTALVELVELVDLVVLEGQVEMGPHAWVMLEMVEVKAVRVKLVVVLMVG